VPFIKKRILVTALRTCCAERTGAMAFMLPAHKLQRFQGGSCPGLNRQKKEA